MAALKKPKQSQNSRTEMEINRTEKLKPDLKSEWNSESIPGCPTQSIDHEYYLKNLSRKRIFPVSLLSFCGTMMPTTSIFVTPPTTHNWEWHCKSSPFAAIADFLQQQCAGSWLFLEEDKKVHGFRTEDTPFSLFASAPQAHQIVEPQSVIRGY